MMHFRSSEDILAELRAKQEVEQPQDQRLHTAVHLPVDQLMVVVVQAQDVRRATQALNKVGLTVTRLPSTGAFLGRRNTTLLIGLAKEQVELAVSLIHENCCQRIEYVSTPLEGAPLPIPVATPVTVGGATVFILKVERIEEI